SDWENIQFTMPDCNQPINILFSNITDVSADMIWSTMPNANGYQYVIDQSYEPPVSGSGTSTTTTMSAHIAGLMPQTKYYAHIRTTCSISDESGWSLDSFITSDACPPPQLSVQNPGTNNLVVQWNEVPTAITYEFGLRNTSQHPAFGTEIDATS